MAKNKKNTKTYSYLEKWYMSDGSISERVVVRDANGKFVDNISLTALKSAPTAPRSRK